MCSHGGFVAGAGVLSVWYPALDAEEASTHAWCFVVCYDVGLHLLRSVHCGPSAASAM